MRKTLVIGMMAAFMAVCLLGGFAGAGRTVTVKKKFAAGPHAPAPVLTDVDPNGCMNTVEGVNKTTVEYHTPKKGTFTAKIFNFSGDWDLYVTNRKDAVLGSSHADQTVEGAPTKETVVVKLPANYHVKVVACNWLGSSPTADGIYTFKYRR